MADLDRDAGARVPRRRSASPRRSWPRAASRRGPRCPARSPRGRAARGRSSGRRSRPRRAPPRRSSPAAPRSPGRRSGRSPRRAPRRPGRRRRPAGCRPGRTRIRRWLRPIDPRPARPTRSARAPAGRQAEVIAPPRRLPVAAGIARPSRAVGGRAPRRPARVPPDGGPDRLDHLVLLGVGQAREHRQGERPRRRPRRSRAGRRGGRAP